MAGKIESNNSFRFVGKVKGDGKSYKEIDSLNTTIGILKLTIQCGGNRHFLECIGFRPKDKNKIVKCFYTDRTSSEVKYSERATVDTENLGFLHPSIKTEEETYRFVSDFDYIEHLKNMLESGKFNGENMYEVSGDIVYENYFNKKGELVEISKYKPTQFIEREQEAVPESIGSFSLYLGDDCFEKVGDVGILTGKSVVRNTKKDVDGEEGYEGYETKITIPLGEEHADEVFAIYKKRYVGSDEAMTRIGIVAEIVNGVEEVEFDESMLTEDEKKLILFGAETFESIKATKGTGKGGFVRENVRIRDFRGYGDGVKETAITLEDLELLERQKTISGGEVFGEKKNASESAGSVPEELSGDEVFGDIFA